VLRPSARRRYRSRAPSDIAASRHRQIAGEKAAMSAPDGRRLVARHQQRRQQQAGVEFEYAPHLGQHQAEAGRAKLGARRWALFVGIIFLVAGATRQDPPWSRTCPENARRSRIEGEPALHQRFRETFSMLASSAAAGFPSPRHRCTSGSPKKLPGFEGVQSISTFTFMAAPDCILTLVTVIDDRRHDASYLARRGAA